MGRWRRPWFAFMLALVALIPSSTGGAEPPSSLPVLRVFIPGSFAGCSTTSSGSSDALKDVLTLVRPSAFFVNPVGRLVGAGGPIASAELVSDEPQTVVLTIDPRFTWSNGLAFSVDDLIHRIEIGRLSHAVWADGFHRIASYTVGTHRKTLRVVFAQKYASWPMMFQGIEQVTTPSRCNFAEVAQRPSLGPYLLESLSANRAVLVANPQFRVRSQQFRTIIVLTGQRASATAGRPIVDYRYSFSQMDATWLASLPGRSGKVMPSQRIVAVSFSPRSLLTRDILIRKVLSLAIDRNRAIHRVFGNVTQSLSPATSSLVAQGQANYTASTTGAPFLVAASTTTTVPSSASSEGSHAFECVSCANSVSSSTVSFSHGRLLWRGMPVTLRLAVGPAESSQAIAQQIVASWSGIGVSARLVFVSTDQRAGQAVSGGDVDAAVTSSPSGYVGTAGASWYGPRRSDTVDFGWRSPPCEAAAARAEGDFNATTAQATWSQCDREIAVQYWQRPIVSVPYLLQWTNTVAGVVPSNTTRGFVDQIPLWSSIQRR